MEMDSPTRPCLAGYPTGTTLALTARTCVSSTCIVRLGPCAFVGAISGFSDIPFPIFSLPATCTPHRAFGAGITLFGR